MSLFHKKPPVPYDPSLQCPAMRRSICNGEMTAGLIDRRTGHFQEVMKVDGQKGLKEFCDAIGADVHDVRTIY